MDVSQQIIDQRYTVIKKIGHGLTSSVYQAVDQTTASKVAVKVFTTNDQRLNQYEQHEIAAMQKMKHENIIKLLGFGNGIFKKEDGSESNVRYIATELATKGDFFDFIASTGGLQEKTARFVMRQVFEAVNYMHEQGIANRDLKLENFLLDENFQIKLIDFGFCAPTAGKQSYLNGLLSTKCGTKNYMAPEIQLGQKYVGTQVDMFSLGVILFIIVTGKPPFVEAVKNDKFYNLIRFGKFEIFWRAHTKFNLSLYS